MTQLIRQVMKQGIVALTLMLTLPLLVSAAQETAVLPPFAAIFAEQIYWFDGQGTSRQISDAGLARFVDNQRQGIIDTSLVVSPNGARLAYVILANNALNIVIHDTASGDPLPFSVTLGNMPYPDLAFSPDGGSLYYREGLRFFRADLDTGESELLFSLHPPTSGGGGGGGSSFPSDPLFWRERTGYLSGNTSIFTVTPDGLLYTPPLEFSMNPEPVGLRFYDFQSGIDSVLSETITNVVLSPEGNAVLGIEYVGDTAQIVMLSLVDGARTEIPVQGTPELVAWGDAGSNMIFYTTRARVGDVNLELLPPDMRETLYDQTGRTVDGTPIGIPRYDVTLVARFLESAQETILWRSDAWAIGRLAAVGDDVFFSEITGLQQWIADIASGLQRPENDSPSRVLFYRLDWESGAVELVGIDIQHAVFP